MTSTNNASKRSVRPCVTRHRAGLPLDGSAFPTHRVIIVDHPKGDHNRDYPYISAYRMPMKDDGWNSPDSAPRHDIIEHATCTGEGSLDMPAWIQENYGLQLGDKLTDWNQNNSKDFRQLTVHDESYTPTAEGVVYSVTFEYLPTGYTKTVASDACPDEATAYRQLIDRFKSTYPGIWLNLQEYRVGSDTDVSW